MSAKTELTLRPLPEVETAVAPMLRQGIECIELLDGFVIESNDQHRMIIETAQAARAEWDKVEAARKAEVKPLDGQRKRIQAIFRPVLDVWATVRQRCECVITDYDRRLFEARVEEARQLAAAEPLDVATGVVEIARVEAPEKKGATQVTKSYEVVVNDLAALVRAVAEGKAPGHFVMPDISAMRIYARAANGDCKIPGVTITTTKSTRIKRGKK